MNVLHNRDCIEVMREMIQRNDKVDLIIADPAYDIKNTKTGGKSNLNKTFQKSMDEISSKNLVSGIDYETVLPLLYEIQEKPNIYIFCNKAQIPVYLDYFVSQKKCSFDIIKWVKTNAVPTYHNKYMSDTEYCLYFRKGGYCNPKDYQDGSTLYQAPINSKDKKKWKHPTIKPLELVDRLVRNSSKEGQLIFDPFMGSGTTGVSSLNHNRKFVGCEISKEYFDIAVERTGITPASNNKNYEIKDNEGVA